MEVIKIYTVLENFKKTKFGEGQCLWLSYGPINHNIVDTLPNETQWENANLCS